MKTTFTKPTFIALMRLFLIATVLATTVLSCGGGGGGGAPAAPPPPTDQDAQGLYTTNGAGSGTFNGTTETLTDIKGMIYGELPNQKFIFFDVATNVLYDGVITSITLKDFTGTAVVYHDGVMVDNAVTVTGTITSRSSIDMTLNVNGNFAGGTIKSLFSSEYDKGATTARILSDGSLINPRFSGAVSMVIAGMSTSTFSVGNNNVYDSVSIKTGPIISCSHDGNVSPISSVNIYTLSESISGAANCTVSSTPGYNGFASIVDGTGADTRLWYAVTNGTNSVFAILNH